MPRATSSSTADATCPHRAARLLRLQHVGAEPAPITAASRNTTFVAGSRRVDARGEHRLTRRRQHLSWQLAVSRQPSPDSAQQARGRRAGAAAPPGRTGCPAHGRGAGHGWPGRAAHHRSRRAAAAPRRRRRAAPGAAPRGPGIWSHQGCPSRSDRPPATNSTGPGSSTTSATSERDQVLGRPLRVIDTRTSGPSASSAASTAATASTTGPGPARSPGRRRRAGRAVSPRPARAARAAGRPWRRRRRSTLTPRQPAAGSGGREPRPGRVVVVGDAERDAHQLGQRRPARGLRRTVCTVPTAPAPLAAREANRQQLHDQPGLADTRLAGDDDGRRVSRARHVEHAHRPAPRTPRPDR